jgi:outer membrane protein assembly factor BamD
LSTSEKKPASSKKGREEGVKALKLNQGIRAKTIFKQVLEDFPDSKERTQALLLLARTHYSFEEYEEAKFHFQKFVDLYPKHKNADRAYFYKAMSDYQRMDLASRDQVATNDARDGFQQLIDRFPKSQYLSQAKQKINECDFNLAKNVLEVGKFYYRTGAYLSAISRFKSLLDGHSKQKFFDEAAFLIAESNFHEQNFKEARLLYKKFTREYPRSRFRLKAKKRLTALR